MAIQPPSDIVLEVTRAVEPSRYQAALQRLKSMPASAAGVDFADTFDAVRPPVLGSTHDVEGALTAMRSRAASVRRSDGDPYRKFEAFVLQNFIEAMLPENGEVVFGTGTAGKIWKSMLAEKMGEQVAVSGGIGIAEMLRTATERSQQAKQQFAHNDGKGVASPLPTAGKGEENRA
ncbi:Rod binding protein [Chelatococcus sambhunathii]|uniref:Rod binding protein n=1 Tax=Chelatococcus sambhunathii TaxID=363953 RepID=A0ABM9U2X5_9HYPH|nr:rod-binding protein [Chelatococcus sambhunathii]CUA85090.1 Rod binding protein [Chelatococcus sambhunathii]